MQAEPGTVVTELVTEDACTPTTLRRVAAMLSRARAGRAPATLTTRTLRPLFCGRANRPHAEPGAPWRLWAEDDAGAPALDAHIQ